MRRHLFKPLRDPQDMSLEELIETQNDEIPLHADKLLYWDTMESSFLDKYYCADIYGKGYTNGGYTGKNRSVDLPN